MTINKIIEEFNTLYKYCYFLPQSNKEEFVNALNKIPEHLKQNIQPLNKIIEEFNTLYKYCSFLPQSNNEKYINTLDQILEHFQQNVQPLNKDIEEFDEHNKPESQSFEQKIISDSYLLNEELEANLAHRIMQKIMNEELEPKENDDVKLLTEAKSPEITKKKEFSKTFIKPTDFTQERTLYSVTRILIPNITNKGKNVREYRVASEMVYLILKLIDGKSSITDLYNLYSYNYANYLEFLDIIYEIEKSELITFIKTENINGKSAWIKIGQLLMESNVVHQININNALNYKKTNKGMLTGEALLDLRFIDYETFNVGLKLQSWFSELIENSVFIEGINKTTDITTNSESVSNILDFIIPIFTPEAKEHIMKSNNKNLSILNNILNGESSILFAFGNNKKYFINDLFVFLKLIQNLDSQHLLIYKKNEITKERSTQIRFGELVINLGLVNEEQIEETFIYRQNNSNRKMYIGEALVELNYLSTVNLENCLNLQIFLNNILSKISYENSFILAIKEILEDYFKLSVNIGKFTKKAFTRPLLNMICITYTFTGELNGQVYYIFDRNFVEKLTTTIMASYGIDSFEMDESTIGELCNMITGNSLTKLSKQQVLCEASMPEIIIDNEIIIAYKQPISILPINSEYGRFIIGFNLKG